MSSTNEERRSWREIAIDLIGERDRRRILMLAEDLDEVLTALDLGKRRRGAVSASHRYQPFRISDRTACEKIVDVAVALMHSDYASMQMLYPERGTGGELRLLSFRGFNPQAATFWEWVRADSKSTCGLALRDGTRAVAPDIAACDFMADSEDQQVYLQTGIRACQTTPLISRAGNIVGMISTHWRTPHRPSETDFRLFDVLARQAADLVERRRQPAEN